ncbi:MAG: hypothetical protein D6815_10100 [Candidatus Dadabacteria bacterium]|nr:MAG: hypothetical protein D6815_10100 [Candidatus Dadabacteria bacterium]
MRFAQNLQAQREYYRAITEYLRALFYAEQSLGGAESDWIDLAVLGIGRCYSAGGDAARASEWLRNHIPQLHDQNIRDSAVELLLRSYLQAKQGRRILDLASRHDSTVSVPLVFQGLAHAQLGRWDRAASIFESLAADSTYGRAAQTYLAVSREAEKATRKSPRLARILGVVPGLGYLYSGHKQTAIAAFLVNGVFAAATIQAFSNDQDILGGFMTLFSVSWYAGSIYGSGKAAVRFNSAVQRRYWSQLVY